jgi:hypothetical protein
MNSTMAGNNPRALEGFLRDLICEVKRPEETDLLVEVLLTMQQTPPTAPDRLSEPITVVHPAPRKQGPAG